MSSSLLAITVMLTLGQSPYGGCQTCNNGGFGGGAAVNGYGGYYGGGTYGGGTYGGGTSGGLYSTGMGLNNYSGSNGDTLLPFDSQEAWMHGYFQEIGAYPGYHYFRPYNYKHVFSQVDLAYRWGQPQGMPYSQQWWHRYHAHAALNPLATAQMMQAPSTNEVELARRRAWRDFQAEQQRATQIHLAPNAPFTVSGQVFNGPTPIIRDPATPAALEQQPGARDFVAPAFPVQNGPRFNEAPVNPEFNSRFAPQGTTPR